MIKITHIRYGEGDGIEAVYLDETLQGAGPYQDFKACAFLDGVKSALRHAGAVYEEVCLTLPATGEYPPEVLSPEVAALRDAEPGKDCKPAETFRSLYEKIFKTVTTAFAQLGVYRHSCECHSSVDVLTPQGGPTSEAVASVFCRLWDGPTEGFVHTTPVAVIIDDCALRNAWLQAKEQK